MDRTKTIYTFMTEDDEKLFCNELQNINSNIKFIDTKPKISNTIKIYDNIIESESKYFCIINFDITPLEEYENYIEEFSGYYHFAQVGAGIIQFLRSKISRYNQNALANGRISASFNNENKKEKMFVNDVFRILNKNGKKIFRTTINREIPIIADIPESKMIGFINVINEYNGTNRKYLSSDTTKDVYFIGERI